MDIVADNITLRPPDLFGVDIDITKGSISCTTLTTGTVSALYKISTLTSIVVGTTLSVNGVDIGSKITNFEGRISSNTSNISTNSTSIGAVTASVASLNSTVYGFGVFPLTFTPGLVDMTAINTASIAGLSTSIGIANGRIDDNDNDISSLNSNKEKK